MHYLYAGLTAICVGLASALFGSPHRLPADLALAPYGQQDPGVGNTTAGAGLLTGYSEQWTVFQLISTAGSAEIRTLPDPPKSGLMLTLVMVSKTQNIVVRCNTPIWVGTNVPTGVTQLGQYITFAATNQIAQLYSVPCTKTSYVGTQATVTNSTGFRWMVDILDGTTVT